MLLVLFALCWITVRTDASILIAGFAVGLVVAAAGGPKRLSRQVTGIAQGFFVPLFFVVLGARIDVRALVAHRTLVQLAVLLLVLDIAIHVAERIRDSADGRGWARWRENRIQLGVPAAVVSLGLQEGLLSVGAGAAIMVAALVSIAVSTAGVAILARDRAVTASTVQRGPA